MARGVAALRWRRLSITESSQAKVKRSSAWKKRRARSGWPRVLRQERDAPPAPSPIRSTCFIIATRRFTSALAGPTSTDLVEDRAQRLRVARQLLEQERAHAAGALDRGAERREIARREQLLARQQERHHVKQRREILAARACLRSAPICARRRPPRRCESLEFSSRSLLMMSARRQRRARDRSACCNTVSRAAALVGVDDVQRARSARR